MHILDIQIGYRGKNTTFKFTNVDYSDQTNQLKQITTWMNIKLPEHITNIYQFQKEYINSLDYLQFILECDHDFTYHPATRLGMLATETCNICDHVNILY